jgi:hypothetical protein
VSDGYTVEPDDIRAHVANINSLIERFETVRSASAAITQADDAFGPLCAWIAPLLEEKHGDVDELIDQGKHNLETHVAALNASADLYEDTDTASASDLDGLAGEL